MAKDKKRKRNASGMPARALSPWEQVAARSPEQPPDELQKALDRGDTDAELYMQSAVFQLLRGMGEDPDRPGLVETPARVAKAWFHCWGASYNNHEQLDELVKLFSEPNLNGTQMVTVKDIVLHSHCEHHLAPFFGVAHISYVPTVRGVIGLSKLARVVEHFSRRLQVQERLTNQVADFLEANLSGNVAVMMEATHMCMVSRGVMQPNAKTITSALRGDYYTDAMTRGEFYRAIGR